MDRSYCPKYGIMMRSPMQLMAEHQFNEVLAIATKLGYKLSTIVREEESKYLLVSQQSNIVGLTFPSLADVMVFLKRRIQQQQIFKGLHQQETPATEPGLVSGFRR